MFASKYFTPKLLATKFLSQILWATNFANIVEGAIVNTFLPKAIPGQLSHLPSFASWLYSFHINLTQKT